jgi:glycosyltransferase involved in cell wall biosynthesis
VNRPPISAVTVVVPAHNEEELLGACLSSLQHAADQVAVPVRILVVLDNCGDGSAAVCAHHGVTTVTTERANVGHARALGFTAALVDADDGTWLSSTDADTTVPPDWFVQQLALAAQGADAVVGIVEVDDWGHHPEAVREQFRARYGLAAESMPTTHPHVHGANLGVRRNAYVAAGGYPPLVAHEDHALVNALDALPDVTVVRTTAVVVTTSARTSPRAPHGFGALLQTYADDCPMGRVS